MSRVIAYCHKSSYDQPDRNYSEVPHLINHYAKKARTPACCLATVTFIGLLQEGLGGKRPGTTTVAVALEAKLLPMTGLAVEVGLMVGHSLAKCREGGREGGRDKGGSGEQQSAYTRGKSVV